MNDHEWLQENLAAYLADGIDTDERQRVEKHLAGCADCARLHQQAKALETYMTDLFTDVRPNADLEARAVQALHKPTFKRPSWLRFAISAAAVVVLGGVGAVVQAVATDGEFVGSDFSERIFARNYLGPIRMAAPETDLRSALQEEAQGVRQKMSTLDDSASMSEKETYATDGIDDVALFRKRIDPDALYNLSVKRGEPPSDNLSGLVSGLTPAGSLTPELNGAMVDKRDLKFKVDVRGGEPATTHYYREEAPKVGQHDPSTTTAQTMKVMNGEEKLGFFPPALAINVNGPSRVHTSVTGGIVGGRTEKVGQQNGEYGFFKPGDPMKPAMTPPAPPVNSPPGNPKPVGDLVLPKDAKPPEKVDTPKDAPAEKAPDGHQKPEPVVHFPPVQPKGDPPQPAADAALKIIRTGDMEFEVASYDAALKNINKLIGGVKGGFILREDSKKQENGKKRGSVIVRMPPQFLPKFMDDLREDLEKAGELKTQKIGSQDVTKDYTDTSSELKALRILEGRLLDIMKNPKSELKDLLNVEKELGVQRVRIEKLEGLIRFYDNSVGLSTLTINLAEKEILSASGMVVSEKVQMRLEVENVADAKDAVIKAAEELKGRVVKAEFKQEKGGQLEAIVHAEIPPAKRKAFTEALEKLGLVSDRESSQSQKAEGGTRSAADVKRRTEDVLFEVSLNNIVGINPRHALVMVVATTDVPANYKKLEDAIRAAQGRVLEGKLNDPDKQRITAVLRFDVPADKKATFDELLAKFGPVLKRDAEEVPANQRATEQRFGFAVFLRSIATLPAREFITMTIVDVRDVQKKAAELAETARANKGVADKPNVTLTRRGETSAVLVLKVPLSANDTVLSELMKAGKVVSMEQKPNPNVPDHELATAQITLNLTGGSPIVPSDEGLWPRIRSGLYLSFTVFAWCITVVIIGLAGVLPWVLVIWGGYKLVTRMSKPPAPQPALAPKSPNGDKPA